MIDSSLIKYLDATAQQRLRELEGCFSTQGWQHIVKWLELEKERLKERALAASTWEENRLATGALAVFEQLTNLEAGLEADYQAAAIAAKEQQEAKAEEAELDYE